MRRSIVRTITASLVVSLLMTGAFTASVAAATQTTTLNFSGTSSVQSASGWAICDTCAPDALFGGDNVGLGVRVGVDVSAHWTPKATVSHQYSPSKLRQGETLDLVNTLTPGTGDLVVTYTLSGDFGIYFNAADATHTAFPAVGSERNIQTVSVSTDGTGTCAMKLDGDGTYACSATKSFTLWEGDLFGIASVKLSLPITTSLSVTPDGVTSIRTVSFGSTPEVGPSAIEFHGPSPSVVSDNFAVSCTAPAGANALYDLASSETNPTLVATTSVSLRVEVTIIIEVADETFTIVTFGPSAPVVMNLTAPSVQVDLGPILADNTPPVVNAGGPYSGNEGQPIQFDASASTDNCASTLGYVWNFSDGGIAYGAAPQHTFADDAIFSGQVTVTDAAGNTASKSFSVTVANRDPIANAGPDLVDRAWGRLIAFNGQAFDAAGDQSTLEYDWDFGDGTPSATGGPSASHAYSTPGVYIAVLTVCDKDGACDTDSRSVTVRKRDVTVGYIGDHSGTYATSTTVAGSLVDEFGAIVPGRQLTFAIGSESAGAASTNSNGIASKSHLLGLASGAYTATGSFAGDSLYQAATDGASYTVGRKATSVLYTGALTGGANKTIVLSAVLKDASGAPLAGRTIDFQLGTQTASATTSASGVASYSLKLTQKNGTYALTATYSPVAADLGLYLGSGDSATFKLQSR